MHAITIVYPGTGFSSGSQDARLRISRCIGNRVSFFAPRRIRFDRPCMASQLPIATIAANARPVCFASARLIPQGRKWRRAERNSATAIYSSNVIQSQEGRNERRKEGGDRPATWPRSLKCFTDLDVDCGWIFWRTFPETEFPSFVKGELVAPGLRPEATMARRSPLQNG